jgi:hypothetical protein
LLGPGRRVVGLRGDLLPGTEVPTGRSARPLDLRAGSSDPAGDGRTVRPEEVHMARSCSPTAASTNSPYRFRHPVSTTGLTSRRAIGSPRTRKPDSATSATIED